MNHSTEDNHLFEDAQQHPFQDDDEEDGEVYEGDNGEEINHQRRFSGEESLYLGPDGREQQIPHIPQAPTADDNLHNLHEAATHEHTFHEHQPHSQQQQFFFNYQQNLPSKVTGASGASEQRTVDVLIIGGGPAALGVLVNAVKTNRLNELLQGDGLAIIDAGLNFGGGILGRYGINSNTSGGGFLKCAYKKIKGSKEKKVINPIEEASEGTTLNKILAESGISKKKGEKTSVVKKPNNAGGGGTGKRIEQPLTNPYAQQLAQSQKNFSAACGLPCFTENNNEILAPFRELYSSHIGRVLKDFGKNTAPLAVIGHYLNYAGNHLLSFIHQTTKKKIFFPLHKAVSIQLMSNGEILTKVKRQQLEITVTEDSESLRIIDTDQVVVFRSRVLIVANGGVQGLHPELFNWFPNVDREKVMASDDFLRSEGYHRGLSLLKDKKKKRVVIIGGSHSGFSCAWMLLNGPAAYYRNNAGLFIDREPSAVRKSVKNCMDCCQCGIVLANMKRAKAQKEAKQEGMTSPAKAGKEQLQCNCLCVCFGLFDYDDWKFETGEGLPSFEEASIQILYREQIKVFYNKVSDAEKDGYNQFEADKFSKKDGYLYSFSGLRGDAKDLYLRIMRGQEKRVTLIQARDAAEQRPYVDQADLVLWCCGYQTNAIPFKDVDRKKLQLSQKVPNTQFDVDGKCRILTSDGLALAKCFACGIAYPVRTKDGMLVSNPTMSNPRADGFSLYMNFVGDQILKGVVPKGKMIRSTVHKVSNKVAGGQENGGVMGDGGTFTKSKYQQVLKARIQQYRHKNTEDEKQRNKSMHVPKKQPQNTHDDDDSLERDHIHDQLLPRPSYPSQLPTEGPAEDQQEQEGSIQPQHDAKKIMSIRDLNKAHAAKSVDRGMLKQGGFQNKFSQMARSPQILQRKQEQIMKMKQESSEMLNNDLADLIIGGSAEENQIIAVSAIPQKGKKFHGKSPYNNNLKYSRQPSQQEGKGLGSSCKPNRGQGVGREVLRSSQGQNRKLDNILAQQQAKASSEDPGIFKMSRSSQVSFNNKQQQQRNGRGSIVNDATSDMMYNSIGSAIGPSNLFNQSTFDQKSQRQGGNGGPGTLKRVELPPILHPLAQNHYVHIPPQSAESLNRGEANDDYLPEGKCSIIKKPFDSKSMRGSSLQTSSLPGGQEDLHPQSQQQNSRKPKPRENPMLRDNNRPLSDNQREDIVHEVVSNGQLQKKNTLIKKKSAGRRNIKLNQKTPETEVKTQRRVERISSLEEEEQEVRQKEMIRPNQPSPSPYENEGFDADDGDIDEHQDLGHDDSHIDNYDEDVSSEGSCRTSIYNRSQRGDDDDSHKQGSSNLTGGENTKASSLHQRGEDSSKKTVESSNRGNLDKISSKYSFQSKIPRLIKPGRIEEVPAVQAKGKFVQVKGESPALHEGDKKLIKRQTGGAGKEQSEVRKIGGGIKQLIENDDASKSALLEVILSNQQQHSKLPPSQQQQSRKHTRANNAVQAASQQQMIPGAQQFSHKINQVRQNAINNSNAASLGGAGHPSTNGSQMVVKKPHVNEVTATKGLKEVAK